MASITINIDFGYRKLSMVLDLDPARDATIVNFLQGNIVYEQDVAHVMMRALREGDVAIDVGANLGFFSVMMASMVAPGKVVAYEPGADNLSRLQRNIEVSGVGNITPVSRPLSDTAGPTQFYLNSDVPGGHALWDPAAFPGNDKSKLQQRAVTMAATTLDNEIARLGLPAPRLIKIDTEGAEHRVLAGATNLLTGRKVPYIVAELHEFGLRMLGSSQEGLRQFMAQFGYDTFALYYDGSLPKYIPPGTELRSTYLINVLFSTIEDVSRLWPEENFVAIDQRLLAPQG